MKLTNVKRLSTKKDAVRVPVRKAIQHYIDEHREYFAEAKKISDGKYETVVNNMDNDEVVYVRFEVKVSKRPFSSLAKKKKKNKKL